MSHSKKSKKTISIRQSSHPNDPKSKGGEEVGGIEVQTTRSVTTECAKALRNIIDDSNLNFKEESFLNEKKVKCRLAGEGARTAVTDKEIYSVLPLPVQARSALYWLGILLEFRFIPKDQSTLRGVYRLTSASLVLFSGEANELRKTPLIRAEWDWREETGPHVHAQPHWHLYRSVLSEVTIQEETADEEVTTLDEASNVKGDGLEKAADFHFAMASTWHLDSANSSKVQISNPQNLANWMSGCIKYTIGQLMYLNK